MHHPDPAEDLVDPRIAALCGGCLVRRAAESPMDDAS